MAKTLADMTAEERQACVGMWCDHILGDGITVERVIFVGDVEDYSYDGTAVSRTLAEYVTPLGLSEDDYLSQFTPRFDLPRAWCPDGTPPKGEWVDGHMWWNEPGDDIQPVDLIGAECLGTGEMQGMDEWPENVTPAVSDEDIQVRRFITEWENANV